MANKRILICSDSKARLDQIHTWFNLPPKGSPKDYIVTRGDGLDRAQYQFSTAGPVRFDLVINAGLKNDGGEQWLDELHARGQLILDVTGKPTKDEFLNRVDELLGEATS